MNSIYASIVACAVTCAGILSIKAHSKWGLKNSAYFVSFASGLIISVTFVHIVPESFSMSDSAPMYLLSGFMGLYMLNRFLRILLCHDRGRRMMSTGIVSIIGIGLHSFIDGAIYSVTYRVGVFTGILATLGMVLHEFPEGIVTYLILEKSGFGTARSTSLALITAAFTTPLGALAALPFTEMLQGRSLGSMLALSAGALIYLGATHLLPSVEKEDRSLTILALIAGIMAAAFIAAWGD